MEFKNKLVAVLNEKKEPGKVMNALAHMCLGLGASFPDKSGFRLANYRDAGNNDHNNISEMPFMILAANSNKIRALRKAAIDNNISYVDYTDKMTEGTYQDQIKRSSETKEEDLEYYGIVLFGEWGKVSELTRKFSLWK